MTRRYDHPKRQSSKHDAEARGIRERLDSEWSPVIDVMFERLHAELAQWPDLGRKRRRDYDIDEHGTPKNPHVFYPNKTADLTIMLRHFNGPEWIGRLAYIPIGAEICPCGTLKSDYEEGQRDQMTMRLYMEGLVSRDVQ